MSKLIFLLYFIGSALVIMHVYALNIRVSFDGINFACFSSFFFAITPKKISDGIGLNRPHVDQQPREPVCMKNGGINRFIAQKVFAVYQKHSYNVNLIL